MILCLVFVTFIAFLASGLDYIWITVPRLISPTDAISMIGVLVTIATFLVSLKVTSVGHTIMRVFLTEEPTRQILLAVGNGTTFDEIQSGLHVSPAQLSGELVELIDHGLIKKKSESVAGKGLVEKYYRNF